MNDCHDNNCFLSTRSKAMSIAVFKFELIISGLSPL